MVKGCLEWGLFELVIGPAKRVQGLASKANNEFEQAFHNDFCVRRLGEQSEY